MPVATRCCRSSPRCADCPVVAAATVRARRREGAVAALVTEVLGGAVTTRRDRPEPVSRALAGLDELRRPRAVAAR